MLSSAAICRRSNRMHWQGPLELERRASVRRVRSGRDNMNYQAGANQALETRAREFQFTDSDFNALRTLVKKMTGISLAESKRELVYGRVSRRVRALGGAPFLGGSRLLGSGGVSCVVAVFSARTTR